MTDDNIILTAISRTEIRLHGIASAPVIVGPGMCPVTILDQYGQLLAVIESGGATFIQEEDEETKQLKWVRETRK